MVGNGNFYALFFELGIALHNYVPIHVLMLGDLVEKFVLKPFPSDQTDLHVLLLDTSFDSFAHVL